MVCVEHVLYAMSHDNWAMEILRHCGADIDDLRIRLETYLSEQTKVPEDRDYQIEQTLGLTRVLQRAAIHVQSSGKKEMDAGDFLAAAMREPESFAVYVLSQQGVTRLDILEFISHGISKIDEPALAHAGADEVEEEEDGGDGKKRPDPLASFTANLNERARDGKIDPVVGRSDCADGSGAVSSAKKQSDFSWRAGGRQNSHRRRAGPGDCREERPRSFRKRRDLRARYGCLDCGYEVSR